MKLLIKYSLVVLLLASANIVLAQSSVYALDNVRFNTRMKSNTTNSDVITTTTNDVGLIAQWEFINTGGGYFFIQNKINGKRLQGNSSTTGVQSSVQITDGTSNGSWVQWQLTQTGSSWYIDNRAHNTRLGSNPSGQIIVGATTWTNNAAKWNLIDASVFPSQFLLSSYTPIETKKVPASGNLTFTFSENVNLTTASKINVYINKSLANSSVSWSLSTSNTLTLSHNSTWEKGSLITVLFASDIKSASGSIYGGLSNEYEFIVDTDGNYGFERIRIDPLVLRNNGTHSIPMLVALPTNRTKKVPVQFWVHGGGWKGGTLTESKIYGGPHSQYLAEEMGIATIEVAYRCSGSNGTFAQAMEDLDAAYQWAVNNASLYNLDLNNSFFAGGSAGTPLSSLAAQRYSNIKAYVGYNGIYNFVENLGPFGTGNAYQQGIPSYTANSSFYNLRANPPATLLLHGNADTTIDYTQSTLFANKIKASGGAAKAIIYNGEQHAFFDPSKVQHEDCLWEMSKFLKSNGITQTENWFENSIFKIDNVGADLRMRRNTTSTDAISAPLNFSGWVGQWKLIDAGDGFVFIENQSNGTRLQGASTATGVESSVKLVSNIYSGTWVQWKLKAVGANWFITNRAHNTRLSMNSSGEVTVSPVNFNGVMVQWKLTEASLAAKESNNKASITTETSVELPEVLIYPNSINSGDDFNLHYTSQVNDNILEIRVIDISGKTIIYRKENLNSGINKLKVESKGLSQGLYFVELSSKGMRNTKKIVIK